MSCSDRDSLPAPRISFQEAIKEANLSSSRIAFSPDLNGIAPVDPEVAEICRNAVDWFSTQGCQVSNACPDISDADHIFQVEQTLQSGNLLLLHKRLPAVYSTEAKDLQTMSLDISALI